MTQRILELIPGVEGEELLYLNSITKNLTEDQLDTFAAIYTGKRKKAETILMATILGLLGIGGIQRILLDQVGLGILYLLTIGLCYIGTIVDLVNYKRLTFEYNQAAANEALHVTKSL